MIKIEIPFETPSTNKLYPQFKGRRILSEEARALKESIGWIILKQKTDGKIIVPECFKTDPLFVVIAVYDNWFTKKGKIKKKDVCNKEKFLIDSIFKSLELDDKNIFHATIVKMQYDKENNKKSIVMISHYSDHLSSKTNS